MLAVEDVKVAAKTKSETITYPFVDLIRFVSTIGIVYIHSELFLTSNEDSFFHKVNHVEYYFALRQVFKFSTICYFLIAGFLLGDKVEGNERFKYFMRRLKVIAKPYVLAVVIFTIIFMIDQGHEKINIPYIIETFKFVLCYTPFWYIPNYLTCLLVMVCFAKYLKSIYFGAFLLAVTLAFTYFNVYSATHTSSHTTAIFGFTFYMWLGVYMKKSDLISKIQKINPVLIISLLLVVFALSNYETWYLFNYTHTRDSQNTLRISNQIYSVLVFMLLVRFASKAPNFGIFKPKQETYGIYLYHAFFIFFILTNVATWLTHQYHLRFFSYNVYHIIMLNIVTFFVCYLATTALVKVLIRFKLAFLPYGG